MSQYRSGQPSAPQTSRSRRSSSPSGGAYLLAAIILGICILIAGLNVGGALRALTKAVGEKDFSSTFDQKDDLTVRSPAPRKYLTQKEAAEYLNLSESDISEAIADGDISDYMITSDGYSISVTALDEFFEQEAYKIQMKRNSSSSDE